ncbi:MAG: cupin domain-containing protein [Anaerolineales bacterium]|nr:cupin domain-containing protein [Anaerolineales bacterium]MCB0011501.1 cupin domain-containing protein [Anaerolineales bacterium]MCB0017733.1 cupin domain-containing protein [Anaerolineales bacterium]
MTVVANSVRDLWFLNTWVTIRVPGEAGQDNISILEHRAPYGDSPPLHIHHSEDEIFHVLEGEFYFRIGSEEHRLSAGDILLAPRGIPHQYLIESAGGGRWLTITTPGDFERFVRLTGRPAEQAELPAPAGPPTPEAAAMLGQAAAECGIEIVGPPLH